MHMFLEPTLVAGQLEHGSTSDSFQLPASRLKNHIPNHQPPPLTLYDCIASDITCCRVAVDRFPIPPPNAALAEAKGSSPHCRAELEHSRGA